MGNIRPFPSQKVARTIKAGRKPIGRFLSKAAPWMSAAAGPASGIIGGALNLLIQSRQAKKERDWQKEMWDMQNTYNSPVSQMERYKQAGLNPNLMYGQGSPGNATQLPKYQRANTDWDIPAPDIGGTLNQYQDLTVKNASVNNMNATKKNTEAKTINEVLKGTLIGEQTSETKQTREHAKALFPSVLSQSQSQADIRITQQETERIKQKYANKTLSIAELDRGWKELKLNTMKKTGVNIERDKAALRIFTRAIEQADGRGPFQAWIDRMEEGFDRPYGNYKPGEYNKRTGAPKEAPDYK